MIEAFIAKHVGEAFITILVGFGVWMLRSYLEKNTKALDMITQSLTYLTHEFHDHRVNMERRVTRVETKVDVIHEDTKDLEQDNSK